MVFVLSASVLNLKFVFNYEDLLYANKQAVAEHRQDQ